jgi:hypothetical protein
MQGKKIINILFILGVQRRPFSWRLGCKLESEIITDRIHHWRNKNFVENQSFAEMKPVPLPFYSAQIPHNYSGNELMLPRLYDGH